MSFDALIEKVRQAEIALEAREREASADWRQARSSWRAAWTPGRIVLAGLASGFLFGRAEPFKKAAGGGALQLISALGTLLAGDKAKEAAREAGQAADAAQDVERTVERAAAPLAPQVPASAAPVGAPPADVAPPPRVGPTERTRSDASPASPEARPYDLPESWRDRGQL